MEKGVKIGWIIGGSILVAALVGTGIYLWFQKKTDKQSGAGLNLLAENTGLHTTDNPVNEVQPLIGPTFNAENELANPLALLKGKTLYPKEKTAGGWDYANVRSSAEVNTDQGWWDTGNKLVTIYKGNPIGRVVADTTTLLNGYAYRWFKVALTKPVEGQSYGYVRADTVTFKAIF